MIAIWEESDSFNSTYQARPILKKVYFSDFEIVEICKQVNS